MYKSLKKTIMKKLFYSIVLLFSIILISQQLKAQVYDQVSLGPNYALDEWYSLENGFVSTTLRTDWDISFYTFAMSSGISINGGAGVMLWEYPYGDTSVWNAVDTMGLSTWTDLVNSQDYWEGGAFGENATGHPDYGWGVYNMATHNLTGDVIFIIKLQNGEYKKIWIVEKQSSANIYTFRYADLNGSNDNTVVLDCNPYGDKNFIYYSIETETVVDRDPTGDSWDFIFTKYNAIQPNGMYYMVTGIQTNVGVRSIRMEGVDPLIETYDTILFTDSISNIGSNWKYFDLGGMAWHIVDSLVFFVENRAGDVYKLVFDGFDGMSTGNAYITKKLLTGGIGIEDVNALNGINVYPNPASENIYVNIDMENENIVKVQVSDLLGHIVYRNDTHNSSDQLMISTGNWNSGLYFVSIQTGNQVVTRKILLNRN